MRNIIPKIRIEPETEYVYNLSFIKPDTELIIYKNTKYIMNKEAYFPIYSDKSFIEKNGKFIIINEYKDVFELTNEQFHIIKELL